MYFVTMTFLHEWGKNWIDAFKKDTFDIKEKLNCVEFFMRDKSGRKEVCI